MIFNKLQKKNISFGTFFGRINKYKYFSHNYDFLGGTKKCFIICHF